MKTISVSPTDIATGQRGNCGLCPVALAMRREGYPFPTVTQADLQWGVNLDTRKRVTPPSIVQRFVRDFDLGKNPGPFTFTLPDP